MAGTPELGAKIKTARTQRGWKQKHLAAEVSVEPITVSRWERGATTPDLDVLGLVAEATGKPLSFFVEDTPAPEATRAAGTIDDAVVRIESAATRIEQSTDRLAAVLEQALGDLSRRS